MSLHLIKLCVGVDSVETLRQHVTHMATRAKASGLPYDVGHTTRSTPTRASEIIGKGSLFWVVKGHVACRQPITDIRPFTAHDGVRRCQLILGPDVVDVEPRPRKRFQGWRYLTPDEAPPDLAAMAAADLAKMPDNLRRELAGLGLL